MRYLAPAEEGVVDLEGGILSGCPNKYNSPIFYASQQCVLEGDWVEEVK